MRQKSYKSFLPRNGLFCFLAQLIASILPSVPLTPKPPGTNTPLWAERKQHQTQKRSLGYHYNLLISIFKFVL